MFDPTSIGWHTAFWASGPLFQAQALADGASVATINDETGNGHTASQATAGKKPVLRSTGLGGKPAWEFDGVDDFAQTGSFTAIGQPATIVLVCQFLALSGTNEPIDGIGSSNRMIVFSNATSRYSINAGTSIAAGTTNTSPHALIAEFNSAANDTLLVDGTNVITGEAGSQSATGLTLGARFDGTAGFANVRTAFVGLIGRVLTSTERQNLDTWAQDFYGITVSDYVAHPSLAYDDRRVRRNSLLRR